MFFLKEKKQQRVWERKKDRKNVLQEGDNWEQEKLKRVGAQNRDKLKKPTKEGETHSVLN